MQAKSGFGARLSRLDAAWTRLESVRPQIPGVDVKVIEAGSRLQLTNDTDTEVVVQGYQGEPYLRVGPKGVFENRKSPATFLNRSRQTSGGPPVDVGS